MDPTWLPEWSEDGPQIDLNIDHVLMPFGIDVWTQFARSFGPIWRQVGTNIEAKIDSNLEARFFKIILKKPYGLVPPTCLAYTNASDSLSS